jgi:hypothetical protein
MSADDLYDLPPGVGAEPSPGLARSSSAVAPLTRCWPDVDAIATTGERQGERFICLLWSRGCCPRGELCSHRHRLPNLADEQRLLYSSDGLTTDIFGRPRGAAREQVLRDPQACQTLQVSGLPADLNQQERRRELDALSEWGAIAKTWVVADPSVGYVKFKWRATAQFVMEAMQGQPLTPDALNALELSWCFADPSAIQAAQAKELALVAMAEARARRESSSALYDSFERERHVQASVDARARKRARATEESADHIKEAAAIPASDASVWTGEEEQSISAVTAAYPGGEYSEIGEGAEDTAPAWRYALDPVSGCPYWYDLRSGQSVWAAPSTETQSGASHPGDPDQTDSQYPSASTNL